MSIIKKTIINKQVKQIKNYNGPLSKWLNRYGTEYSFQNQVVHEKNKKY